MRIGPLETRIPACELRALGGHAGEPRTAYGVQANATINPTAKTITRSRPGQR